MPIHDLGYRGWDSSQNVRVRKWLVIAQTGIRLSWTNLWLRRTLFLAWFPAAYLALGFFMYEQSLTQPQTRFVLYTVMARFRDAQPLVRDLQTQLPSGRRIDFRQPGGRPGPGMPPTAPPGLPPHGEDFGEPGEPAFPASPLPESERPIEPGPQSPDSQDTVNQATPEQDTPEQATPNQEAGRGEPLRSERSEGDPEGDPGGSVPRPPVPPQAGEPGLDSDSAADEQAGQEPLGEDEEGDPLAVTLDGEPLGPEQAAALLEQTEALRHRFWALLLMMFFSYHQGVLTVLMVGMIAPPLITRDIRTKGFLLYFCRPLSPLEYVFGKASIVWAYLALITMTPGLVLYLLGVMLSPDLSVVLFTWDLPLRVILASVVMIVPTTFLALMFSSLTTESRYAGFAWFAVWILGWVAYSTMSQVAANRNWSALSLYHTLSKVQKWVFGLSDSPQESLAAATLLFALTIASLMVVLRRVSAPMRI